MIPVQDLMDTLVAVRPMPAFTVTPMAAFPTQMIVMLIGIFVFFVFATFFFFFLRYFKLWFQAYMSVADVSLVSLIRMHFTKVNPNVVVQAKVMSAQAGLNIDRNNGISTRRLEAHFLAGGNVMNVIHAIIAAPPC